MNYSKRDYDKAQIVIRQLAYGDSRDLIRAGFPFNSGVLSPFLPDKVFHLFNFHPYQTRLVAYNVQKKRAIGYLSLVAHTQSLNSIRYVFSDPNFRKKGVATGLITHSLALAKNKGVKKVFLTAKRASSASRLYEKLGFRIISEYPRVEGAGPLVNFQHENQNQLIKIYPISQKNKEKIFSIYKNCMSQDVIKFFEINVNNFINGYSQDFRLLFIKNVFVSDLDESLALIFHLPFAHTAVVEFYINSNCSLSSTIKGFINTLYSHGIKYAKINLFCTESKTCFNLLEKNGFYPYQGIFMGKSL